MQPGVPEALDVAANRSDSLIFKNFKVVTFSFLFFFHIFKRNQTKFYNFIAYDNHFSSTCSVLYLGKFLSSRQSLFTHFILPRKGNKRDWWAKICPSCADGHVRKLFAPEVVGVPAVTAYPLCFFLSSQQPLLFFNFDSESTSALGDLLVGQKTLTPYSARCWIKRFSPGRNRPSAPLEISCGGKKRVPGLREAAQNDPGKVSLDLYCRLVTVLGRARLCRGSPTPTAVQFRTAELVARCSLARGRLYQVRCNENR